RDRCSKRRVSQPVASSHQVAGKGGHPWPHFWRLRRRFTGAIVRDRGNQQTFGAKRVDVFAGPEAAVPGRTLGGCAAASMEISKRLRRVRRSLPAGDRSAPAKVSVIAGTLL